MYASDESEDVTEGSAGEGDDQDEDDYQDESMLLPKKKVKNYDRRPYS